MNGLMKNYKQSLIGMPAPILPSQLPKVKVDLRALVNYASTKNKKMDEMSEEELRQFFK